MEEQEPKRLGYWLSQKKSRKLSLSDIEGALRARNVEPVKIDIYQPLEKQGPFDGILHKLTDFIASAELGDKEACQLMAGINKYILDHPDMLMIDSVDCLRTLINRLRTYTIIETATERMQGAAFIPKFVVLESIDAIKNAKILADSGVSYPAVCKPIVAHGLNAHQMTLIFNKAGLKDVAYPCVVQSFVNHNALLYKLFTLGEKYFMIERPSIKNFYKCEDHPPIHFDGNEVSKANSMSVLTVQECAMSNGSSHPKPSEDVFALIVREIGRAMELRLFGVDVVLDATTGRYAIVDVNAFPGYDGVNNFAEELAEYVRQELDKQPDSNSMHVTNGKDYSDSN